MHEFPMVSQEQMEACVVMAMSDNQRMRCETRRAQVFKMRKAGKRPVDISRALGVSPQLINADLKALNAVEAQDKALAVWDARRLEVAKLMRDGMKSAAIAKSLKLNPSTVNNDLYAIRREGVAAFILRIEGNDMPQAPMFWGLGTLVNREGVSA